MAIIKGKVYIYGDDVNTDVIFPGKYTYTVTEPSEIAKHALEDEDPDFVKTVEKGDIIIAGKNFGCGSSREQAAFCFKYLNMGAIIAESYSRIYFRNCINAGLPALEIKNLRNKVKKGDILIIDTEKGIITLPNNEEISFPPLPKEVEEIMEKGGLVPFIKDKIAKMKKG